MKIKFLKDFIAAQSNDYSDLHTILIERGDIVDVDGCRYNGHYFDMPKEQAQWLIDNGFAEEVKGSGWWRPKLGDTYYITYPDGIIASCTWDRCGVDENRFSNGAVFKTEEATERWRDYLKAIATVRQDEGVLTPNELQEKKRDYKKVVFIGYDSMGRLATNPISLFSYDIVINAILFDNETNARASLDNHPSEWKIIANYDWSRE